MDFLSQLTGFLASILPWIVIIFGWAILRKLSRVEKGIMLLSLSLGLRPFSFMDSFNPKQRKGGMKEDEAGNR